MKNALKKLIIGEGEANKKLEKNKSRCLAPARYAEKTKNQPYEGYISTKLLA